MFEPIVRTALLEDLGRAGDITADAIVPADAQSSLVLRAPPARRCRGLDIARCAFQLVSPATTLRAERPDGSVVTPGDTIATIEGPARALLTGERTALNFLCHLSGVATATATLVTAAKGTKAQIVCTRKTTPGLRALEKYAVRAGGGGNHRFGLDDAMLIKDNHIALAAASAPRSSAPRRTPATSSRSRSRSIRWRSSNRRFRSASMRCCSTTCPSRN
jgi:nicotinate-nucleotide pyrophosphorylase (carboxylating)